MTVEQLIAELRKWPQADEVCIGMSNDDFPNIRTISDVSGVGGSAVDGSGCVVLINLTELSDPRDGTDDQRLSARQIAESVVCAVLDTADEHKHSAEGVRLIALGDAVLDTLNDHDVTVR